MNFYTCLGRFLPSALAKLGWTCLAMNRRGHDLGGIRNGRASYGAPGSVLPTASSILPAAWRAQTRGFRRIVLVGHSFGGITSAAYAADHPGDVTALALCSAGRGGREYLSQVSRAGELARDRHAEVDTEARRLVAQRRGDQMIALPGWWYAITAASWVDLSENVPVTATVRAATPGQSWRCAAARSRRRIIRREGRGGVRSARDARGDSRRRSLLQWHATRTGARRL